MLKNRRARLKYLNNLQRTLDNFSKAELKVTFNNNQQDSKHSLNMKLTSNLPYIGHQKLHHLSVPQNTRFVPLLLTKAMELNGTEEESKSWLKTLRMARKQREFCLLITFKLINLIC